MLRLKETPREWQKFVAVMGVAANGVAWIAWWRGHCPRTVAIIITVLALLALITALIQPRWFRGFYRGGMRVSFQIGQVIGKVLLTLFFFVIVTPMGIALRLMGKDLLELRRDRPDQSRWHTARNSREFDRMF
jgi:hypothetical protein